MRGQKGAAGGTQGGEESPGSGKDKVIALDVELCGSLDVSAWGWGNGDGARKHQERRGFEGRE